MAEKKVRNSGGGKLNRTQTVTLRLDPRLRYLTELAARTQRRTTSGFIEWAIEQSLDQVVVRSGDDCNTTLAGEAFELWDVDEADRFIKLATRYPYLLSHEEQIAWKLVDETDEFWAKDSIRTYENIHIQVVRDDWELIKQYSKNEITRDEFRSRSFMSIPI